MAEAGAASDRRLVLASASPRRLELLRLAGLDPQVRIPHVDESLWASEEPGGYVLRLARDKARAVAGRPQERTGETMASEVVLAADTAVVCDGVVLGKPGDAEDARRMLTRLSGREHEVTTGVAVVAFAASGQRTALLEERVVTRVRMVAMTAERIATYVASGEPMDKAGAYAIQGRAAAMVKWIEGSYTNVVGLPLAESLALLRRAGLTPP